MTSEQARIHTEHFDELAKEKRSRAIDSANAAFQALAADELEDAREYSSRPSSKSTMRWWSRARPR